MTCADLEILLSDYVDGTLAVEAIPGQVAVLQVYRIEFDGAEAVTTAEVLAESTSRPGGPVSISQPHLQAPANFE